MIEDIDLNVFTRRAAVTKPRLADRGGPDPFVALERIEVRLSLAALLRSEIRPADVVVVTPAVRVVRTGAAAFNFSDLFPPPATAPPPEARSAWTLTVDRLTVSGGTVTVDDRAVAPSTRWSAG